MVESASVFSVIIFALSGKDLLCDYASPLIL